MSTSNFSGFLSAFNQSYNSLDILSQINYINPNSGGNFTGQIAVIIAGGLVFGWANANSFMSLPNKVSLSYGTFDTGSASFPFTMSSTVCAALGNQESNSLLAVSCLVSGGNTTIQIFSPNGSSLSAVKFCFLGVAITSWIPSPTPNFSGYLSSFNGSLSNDIMEKGNFLAYTSVTGSGGSFSGLVATGRIGNFRVAFNANGYLSFGGSKTLTVTIPVVFASNSAFGFCCSIYPNIIPNITSVTTAVSSTTFVLDCANYYSGYMETNFIIIGQSS